MNKDAVETWAHRTSIALVVALLASLPPQDTADSKSPFDFYSDPDLVGIFTWHDIAASRRLGETWSAQELLGSTTAPPFPIEQAPTDTAQLEQDPSHPTADVFASPTEQPIEKVLPKLDAEPGIEDSVPEAPPTLRID